MDTRRCAEHRYCPNGRQRRYSDDEARRLAKKEYDAQQYQKKKSESTTKSDRIKHEQIDYKDALLSIDGRYICLACGKPLDKPEHRQTHREYNRNHQGCERRLLTAK